MKIKVSLQSKILFRFGLLATVLSVGTAYAKVDAETAKKLGTVLTGVGAEKAANADGTIPEWTGGMTVKPDCYDGGNFLCDPFPDDKPLFVITAENKDQYKDKLAVGQLALLEKYPSTFRIPVYQTRRTSAYAPIVYEASIANATTTELADGGNGVKNYKSYGMPFPIPTNGNEAVWNHLLRFRGMGGITRNTSQAAPREDGSYTIIRFKDQTMFRASMTDIPPEQDDNVLFYYKQIITSPARLAGTVVLVHETIDQVAEPRRSWLYNAGQRRVRRAPQIGYDAPGGATEGASTLDNGDMYNGATDRYNWELKGKKELYIAANSFKLEDPSVKYDDIIKSGHINADLTRYELRRVWVVEGKLKPDTRHIYHRRVFYIDEDTWQIAVADHYDSRNNLWRVSQAYAVLYYDVASPHYAVEVVHDLNNGRYIVIGLENEEKIGIQRNQTFRADEFSPNNLRMEGVR